MTTRTIEGVASIPVSVKVTTETDGRCTLEMTVKASRSDLFDLAGLVTLPADELRDDDVEKLVAMACDQMGIDIVESACLLAKLNHLQGRQ